MQVHAAFKVDGCRQLEALAPGSKWPCGLELSPPLLHHSQTQRIQLPLSLLHATHATFQHLLTARADSVVYIQP
jgi:hypothetical protein